jgi:hypothetical protein
MASAAELEVRVDVELELVFDEDPHLARDPKPVTDRDRSGFSPPHVFSLGPLHCRALSAPPMSRPPACPAPRCPVTVVREGPNHQL